MFHAPGIQPSASQATDTDGSPFSSLSIQPYNDILKMDALDSLVDFAAFVSNSTAYTIRDHVDRNDDNLIPLPMSCVETDEPTLSIHRAEHQNLNGPVPNHWSSDEQRNAFAEIYQKPVQNDCAHVHEDTVFQETRQKAQWSNPLQIHVYSARELSAHPGPNMNIRRWDDHQYMPPYVRPFPLDHTVLANLEPPFAYQHTFNRPIVEEERQAAISRERLHGCADPKCDCRFYNVQTPYAIEQRGPIQGGGSWEANPSRFSTESGPETWAIWEMDEVQMKTAPVQPY